MFTAAFFLRVLIVAIGVVFFWLLLPPFLELLKVHPPEALMTIIRLCVAAIAIFYVLASVKAP